MGLGRAANLYPEITIDQGQANRRAARQQNFDLAEIGWRLWLTVTLLDAVAGPMCSWRQPRSSTLLRRSFREALNSDKDDAIQELADQAYCAETSHPLFRQVRKALGPDRLSSIVLHIMQMALGEFTAVSTQAELTCH